MRTESKTAFVSKVLKDTKKPITNVLLIEPTNLLVNPKFEVTYTSLIKKIVKILNKKMKNVQIDVQSLIPVVGKVAKLNISSACHEIGTFNTIFVESLNAGENVTMEQTDLAGLKPSTETPSSRKFDIYMEIDVTEKSVKVYVISKTLEIRKPSPLESFFLGNTKINLIKPKPISLNAMLTQFISTKSNAIPICLELEATLTSSSETDKVNLMLRDSEKQLFQSLDLDNKHGSVNDIITRFQAEKFNELSTKNITTKLDQITVDQKKGAKRLVEIPLRIIQANNYQKRTSNISANPTTTTAYGMIKGTGTNTLRSNSQHTTVNLLSFDSKSSRYRMPVGTKICAKDISTTEKSSATFDVATDPQVNLKDLMLTDTSPVMARSVAREPLSTKLSPLSTDSETTRKDMVLDEVESIVIDTEFIDPELTLNYLIPIKTNLNDADSKMAELETLGMNSVSKEPLSKIIPIASDHQSITTFVVQKELRSTDDDVMLPNNETKIEEADEPDKEIGLEKPLLTKFISPITSRVSGKSQIKTVDNALTDHQKTHLNVISTDSTNGGKVTSQIPGYLVGKISQQDNAYATENVEFKRPVNTNGLSLGDKYITQRVVSKRPTSRKRTVLWREGELITVNLTTKNSSYTNVTPSQDEFHYAVLNTSYKMPNYTTTAAPSINTEHRTAVVTSQCKSITKREISEDPRYSNVSIPFKNSQYTKDNWTSEEPKYIGVRVPSKESEYITVIAISKDTSYSIETATSKKKNQFTTGNEDLGNANVTLSKDSEYTTFNVTPEDPNYTPVTVSLEENEYTTITTSKESSYTKESEYNTFNVTSEDLGYTNLPDQFKENGFTKIKAIPIQPTYSNATTPSKKSEYTIIVTANKPNYIRLTAPFKESNQTTIIATAREPKYTNGTVPFKDSKYTKTIPIQPTYPNVTASSKKSEYTTINATFVQSNYSKVIAISKDSQYTTINSTYEHNYTTVRAPSKESEYATPLVTSKVLGYTRVTAPSKESEDTTPHETSEVPSYTTVRAPSKKSEDTTLHETSEVPSYTTVRAPSKESEDTTPHETSEVPSYTTVRAPSKESEHTTLHATSEVSSYTTVRPPSEESEHATSKVPSYTTVRASSKESEDTTFHATSKVPSYTTVRAPSKESEHTTLHGTSEVPSYTTVRPPSKESEHAKSKVPSYTTVRAPFKESEHTTLHATSKDSEHRTLHATSEVPSYTTVRPPSKESEHTTLHATSKVLSCVNVTSQFKESKNTTVIATSEEAYYTVVTSSSKENGYATINVRSDENSYTGVSAPFKESEHKIINATAEELRYSNVTATSKTRKYFTETAVWENGENATGTTALKKGERTNGRAPSEESKDSTVSKTLEEDEYRKIKIKPTKPSYSNIILSSITNMTSKPRHTTSTISFRKYKICSGNISCKDTTNENVVSDQLGYATINLTPIKPSHSKRILSRASEYSEINVTTEESGYLGEKVTSKKPEYFLKNLIGMKAALSEIYGYTTTNTSKQASYITQMETFKIPSSSIGYQTFQQSYSSTSENATESATSNKSRHSLEGTVRVSTFPSANNLSTELSFITITWESENSTVDIVSSETKEAINSGLISGIVIAIAIVIGLVTSFLIYFIKKRNTNEELEIKDPVYRQKDDV
ncbi:cell wall protein DAN4-like [Limulus polyphemus]|uniref:Cell wall protein DAN4-like n=1 Tax=Limulus polyphemus TaxID=6850 RepID=A0ABM1S4P9_LIMPO|nr:cell wall protein DAN4-like [Limulus polyphemus]